MHKILFFGELPPKSINGVSFSNEKVLEILSDNYDITVVQENSKLINHNTFKLRKLIDVFNNTKIIYQKSRKNKYSFFYLSVSLSTFGIFKTILICFAYKVVRNKNIFLHLHRGDLYIFLTKKYNYLLFRILSLLADRFIVLSLSLCNVFQKFNHIPIFLNNTISIELNLGEKKFGSKVFIYISNYIEEKGILDLLESFREINKTFPDYRLECYGSFSSEVLKETILSYKSETITINTSILGEEKYKKIFGAEALILPSHNEGQPLIILEAMSIGTPIIATDVGFIKETIGLTYPHIIPPKNKDLLKIEIKAFIENPLNNKVELSKYVKNRYYEFFSQMIFKEKVNKLFSSD